MFQLNRELQTISIEGTLFSSEYFQNDFEVPKDNFLAQLYLFLRDWFSKSNTLVVQTSGSTGEPKKIEVEKDKMMQSAVLTCSYLDLKKKDKALLCMSLDYIAGKMLVVRALVTGLDLYPVSPSGNPLKKLDMAFDFAAMIPMQVYNSLQNDIEKCA